MYIHKDQEYIPDDHTCKYCNRTKKDAHFRWSYDRKTGERKTLYSMCTECMDNKEIKERFNRPGYRIRLQIKEYFENNYT